MRITDYIQKAVAAAVLAASCVAFSLTSFAAPTRPAQSEVKETFPFDLVLDFDTCERKCYTGYGKKYVTGYGISPDMTFTVVSTDPTADASLLKIDIDMISQKDSGKGSKTEKIITYDYGDIEADSEEYYAFFSDRSLENLEESGKLYSDTQRSLRVTMTYKGSGKETEKRYFQVCTFDDLMYYIDNAEAAEEEAAEEEAGTVAVYMNGELVEDD